MFWSHSAAFIVVYSNIIYLDTDNKRALIVLKSLQYIHAFMYKFKNISSVYQWVILPATQVLESCRWVLVKFYFSSSVSPHCCFSW